MISVPAAFAPTYARARTQFLEAAAIQGLPTQSFNHPLPGRDGEDLAMDIALDGPPNADKLLAVSSACHGVEGFCGSGVQVFALHDADWRDKAREAGIAVLYIHALNPHGFSHLRRVTHDNVDLNRNFVDFSQPLPANPDYATLHPLMLPDEWPPTTKIIAACAEYIRTHGDNAIQNIVTRGQYTHADGLFYGGAAPTWSNTTLRNVLRQYAQQARRIAWIDLHTGLGPRGLGERIYDGPNDHASYARAQAWWGNAGNSSGETPVTSVYDGSSTSAYLTGQLWQAVHASCPQAQHTAITLEYGTEPLDNIMDALRADHWLHLHPQASATVHAQIKLQIRQAFYPDADDWKGMVISQARQVMFQAVDGLAA
jgi:Protein of unknown function (DUF2817)